MTELDSASAADPGACAECGGAQSPGTDLPPCLCELGPPSPEVAEAAPATRAPDAPLVKGGTATEARALRCPSCGGWLETGVRTCGFCSVELASVRCWRCFALSFAGGANCGRCGAALGLEGDLGPTEDTCVACGVGAMHVIDVGEHRIRECPDCGSVMVDHETMRRLTRARELEAGETMRGGAKKVPLEARPLSYRRCPQCDVTMMPKNFGRSSGVIVDVCKEHGVFFDPQELTHVLEFVATGGLAQQRRREVEDAKNELRARRAEAVNQQVRMVPAERESGWRSAGALLGALVEMALHSR